MKIQRILLLSFAALTLLVASSSAQVVAINNWTESGGDVDNTFTGNGTSGFTELFGTDTQSGNYASGAIATFQSDVTLSVNQTLSFSLTMDTNQSTGNANNTVRFGFENDDAGNTFDASVHYIFGWGADGPDARFAGQLNNNNEYSSGTTFDTEFNVTGANELSTGNTSNITVNLTYLGDAGGGLFNYEADIVWDAGTHSTSASFTRNTNTWDKVYVLTNSNVANVLGDGYTISNAQVQVVPEPSTFALLILGLGMLAGFRRRTK
ncbi:MAG: PEP-CTERM sorting domain-containing protein [Verrucomicrobiota bacterium]